jgi:hypothetical protein
MTYTRDEIAAMALVEAIVATIDPSTGLSGEDVGLWISRLPIHHTVTLEDLSAVGIEIRGQRSPKTWEEWQGRLVCYCESRDHGLSHGKSALGACKRGFDAYHAELAKQQNDRQRDREMKIYAVPCRSISHIYDPPISESMQFIATVVAESADRAIEMLSAAYHLDIEIGIPKLAELKESIMSIKVTQ